MRKPSQLHKFLWTPIYILFIYPTHLSSKYFFCDVFIYLSYRHFDDVQQEA